jgi:23S rRNA pseudouridine955/2504/2580 synthase
LNSNIPQKSKISFVEVTAAQVDQRLDNFLFKTLKSVPKSRIYRIIRKGEVRVNKKRCKPDYKLGIGDLIRVPPVRLGQKHDPKTYIPPSLVETIEKAVLFENKHLLVIDKPAGLAVHSGSGISYGVIDIMRRIRPETEINWYIAWTVIPADACYWLNIDSRCWECRVVCRTIRLKRITWLSSRAAGPSPSPR